MPAAMRTNIGLSRIQNEDSAWYDADKGIFAVADGMGGHLAGEVASAMAIEAVRKMAEGAGRASFPQLRDAFAAANADILKHAETHAECSGMGTTLSVLWLSGDRAYLAHTGDSRIYRLRDGNLTQITRDHSLVEELVEAAKLLGINLYACEMAMHVLGLKKEDFIPEVKDVLGVASFLNLSEGGQTLFI